jgi:hypothetical protein
MMATTHALAGLLLGSLVATVAPGVAEPAIVAGLVGGAIPDLDLYVGHRKTLHFPVAGSFLAGVATVLAVLVPGPLTVAVAVFLAAAALHSVSDAAGGGLELRPWRATSERAVYDHVRGRWLRPRRWVRYDGAPEDAALAGLLAAPSLLLTSPDAVPMLHTGVVAVVGVSAAYALLRRRVAALTARIATRAPASLRSHLPDRFFETHGQ